MKIIYKIILLTIVIFLSSGVLSNKSIIAQTPQLLLRFGYYTKDFGGVKNSEMDQSLKMWVETIKKNTKVKMLATSIMRNTFYDSKKTLVDDIVEGNLDFMNLGTIDFFGLNLEGKIIPLLATSKRKEDKFERYYLVTPKNSPITNISNLSTAKIVIPNSFSAALMKIWIQVELKEKLSKNIFSKIEIIESLKKESETLFALFFNKLDFAVVKEDSYLIASEINPQIKNNTKIIAASSNYINNFFARRKDLDPVIYKEIVKIGLTLDTSVEGKQVLNLMQMTNMHEINLIDLKETELLIKRYKKLFE